MVGGLQAPSWSEVGTIRPAKGHREEHLDRVREEAHISPLASLTPGVVQAPSRVSLVPATLLASLHWPRSRPRLRSQPPVQVFSEVNPRTVNGVYTQAEAFLGDDDDRMLSFAGSSPSLPAWAGLLPNCLPHSAQGIHGRRGLRRQIPPPALCDLMDQVTWRLSGAPLQGSPVSPAGCSLLAFGDKEEDGHGRNIVTACYSLTTTLKGWRPWPYSPPGGQESPLPAASPLLLKSGSPQRCPQHCQDTPLSLGWTMAVGKSLRFIRLPGRQEDLAWGQRGVEGGCWVLTWVSELGGEVGQVLHIAHCVCFSDRVNQA